MVDLYVVADESGHISSYGKAEYGAITEDPKDSTFVSIPEGHDFFNNSMCEYKIANGVLIRDNSKKMDIAKERKKQQLSLDCSDCILSGYEAEVREVNYHFSYDKEAQANISERWQLFQNDMIDSIRITAHDSDGDDIRIELNKEEYSKLYLASVQHKERCISHYRDELLPLVEQANSVEEIEAITWETQIINPAPEPIVVKDDKTLEKQLRRQKIEQVRGDEEVMGLLMMVGGMS